MTTGIVPRPTTDLAVVCADRADGLALVAIRVGDALAAWGRRAAARSRAAAAVRQTVEAEIADRRARHPLTLG